MLTTTYKDHYRGYAAAAYLVEKMLDEAREHRPKRLTPRQRKSGSYREGYWDGLLMAHCMHALGEFPLSHENPAQIEKALADRDAQRARLSA